MSDQHTDYVLEAHGFETALHFHLTSRVFPPRPEMAGTATMAIAAYNAGEPDEPIGLPSGVTYRGVDTAPAHAIVGGLNLWSFINDDDDDTSCERQDNDMRLD